MAEGDSMRKVYITMAGDLFHRGHLELIKKAKLEGDYLIVGLHPDDVITSYKRKPVVSFEDRLAIISSIGDVDEVVEDCMDKRSPTMLENILKFGVDVVVHGDDWTPPLYTQLIKDGVCEVKLVPYYPYINTTKLIQSIREKNNLKQALKNNNKLVVVSANDAITAKLVEDFGFDGIWVSSFESSARMGLVDNETINLTDMLTITMPIVNSVNIPVIVDVDTGYGDIEQVVRAVRELERIGVSAITIEDNIFPKSNSLWGGAKPIQDIIKQGNKITAAVNSRRSSDLLIVARTEALIRGFGEAEALKRANHYADCGADIVLIHSRETTGKEALGIPKKWNRDRPLIIIPSKFPHLSNSDLFNAGYSIVIYANQTQRAKIFGVKQMLSKLKTNGTAASLKDCICSLDDFRNLTPIEETKTRLNKDE